MMSVFEIAQMYKEAADKNAQIEILADLNACSKEDILLVLQNEGLISGVKKKAVAEGKKQTAAKTRMEWTNEVKEQVRSLLAQGLTVLEAAERMGLDYTQVRNAVTRFKLKDGRPKTAMEGGLCKGEKEPLERAKQKVEPLSVVSLIRDYAKCITALSSADIRNYEKIVRTFAESIMEGADSILREGAKYGG